MVQHRMEFAARCGWQVGRGDISFWFDNWCPKFSFAPFAMEGFAADRLRDFWTDGHWDFEEITPTVGEELALFALDRAPTLTEDRDILFWRLTASGCFSVSTAWDSIRQRGPVNRVLAQTWSTSMPAQSKILIWRLLKAILSVDLVAKRRGIHLASQCVCCAQGKEESLSHLFLEGDLVVSLWSYFGAVFGVRNQPTHSLMARLASWFFVCKGSSHFATLGRMAAIAICRQIWSFRNNRIYGGMMKPVRHARLVVIDTLQFVEHLISPCIESSNFGKDSLLMIGITPRWPPLPPLRRGQWVPPAGDSLSAHCASVCSESTAAVGAIIRDQRGSFVGAVAGPIGVSFSLASELLALRWNVELAMQVEAQSVDFWTHSDFLVNNIGLPCPLWNHADSWEIIQAFFHHQNAELCRTSRRGNAIAVALADWGLSLERVTFFRSEELLPLRVRRALVRDARAFVDPGG